MVGVGLGIVAVVQLSVLQVHQEPVVPALALLGMGRVFEEGQLWEWPAFAGAASMRCRADLAVAGLAAPAAAPKRVSEISGKRRSFVARLLSNQTLILNLVRLNIPAEGCCVCCHIRARSARPKAGCL